MHPRAVVHVGDSIRSDLLGALGCGMRAILLSRNDFKRSAADEAAGRPPADDARWREVYTLHLAPCTLHLAPCTLHLTAHYLLHVLLATFAACYLPLATCHLPGPTTYWREVCDLDEAAAVLREWGAL